MKRKVAPLKRSGRFCAVILLAAFLVLSAAQLPQSHATSYPYGKTMSLSPVAPFAIIISPSGSDIPLDTPIQVETWRPVTVGDLNLTPVTPVLYREEKVVVVASLQVTFYLSEQLQPNTFYTVSVPVMNETISWNFTTGTTTTNPTPGSTNSSAVCHFTPSSSFAIPMLNGSIAFAADGSYESATLNREVWDFAGFALCIPEEAGTTLPGMGKSNFSVSTQNSNITILCVENLNVFPPASGWLNYTVNGVGTQTFNMYYGNNSGMAIDWTVYIDGVNRAQGEGWDGANKGWITVTGASSSICIHRDNINPVEVKVREFKAQGMNDMQIVAELAKGVCGGTPRLEQVDLGRFCLLRNKRICQIQP
jgi:hypothetical protein